MAKNKKGKTTNNNQQQNTVFKKNKTNLYMMSWPNRLNET